MKLPQIQERLNEIQAELRSLLDLDEMSEEQAETYETLEVEADDLLTRKDKLEKSEARLEAIGKVTEVRGDNPPTFQKPTDNPYEMAASAGMFSDQSEMRGKAMKAVEIERDISDADKEHVTRLLERRDVSARLAKHIVATGRPEYRYAWTKLVTGNEHLLSEDERRAVSEVRAASLTDASGGFAVPFTLDPTVIITGAGTRTPMRQIARQVSITTDNWNGVTAAQVTASWDGEAAEVSDDAPTLVQPSIDAEKAQVFVPASIEISQDWPGMADEIATLFADAKANLEGTAFVTGAGAGSNQPNGVVTAVAAVTASRVAATTNNAYGAVDVYAVQNALPVRHQDNASWMANLAVINLTRQFGTAQNHSFLVDFAGGQPTQLLGQPLYQSSAMDGALATGDDDILLYGDFSKYLIVDRIGFAIEFIPHLFATGNNRPSGQRGWYGYWRVGGGTVDNDAFRILRV